MPHWYIHGLQYLIYDVLSYVKDQELLHTKFNKMEEIMVSKYCTFNPTQRAAIT